MKGRKFLAILCTITLLVMNFSSCVPGIADVIEPPMEAVTGEEAAQTVEGAADPAVPETVDEAPSAPEVTEEKPEEPSDPPAQEGQGDAVAPERVGTGLLLPFSFVAEMLCGGIRHNNLCHGIVVAQHHQRDIKQQSYKGHKNFPFTSQNILLASGVLALFVKKSVVEEIEESGKSLKRRFFRVFDFNLSHLLPLRFRF